MTQSTVFFPVQVQLYYLALLFGLGLLEECRDLRVEDLEEPRHQRRVHGQRLVWCLAFRVSRIWGPKPGFLGTSRFFWTYCAGCQVKSPATRDGSTVSAWLRAYGFGARDQSLGFVVSRGSQRAPPQGIGPRSVPGVRLGVEGLGFRVKGFGARDLG